MLKFTPKKYINSEVEGITSILNIGSLILPIVLLISLVVNAILADRHIEIVIILLVGVALSIFIRITFLRGYLKQSVMAVAVFFTILLTAICSLGNGIHDITIIGFPIIIGFSSILLDKRQMVVASILSVMGLAWIVIGDRFEFFETVNIPSGDTGDFIIASSIIILGGFVAFSLTTSMKDSLRVVNQEINTSKDEADKLVMEIHQKEEIIDEIHQAVINSLSQLELIIDDLSLSDQDGNLIYNSIERKILVIKSAHEILHSNQSPLILDLNEFASVLLEKIEAEGLEIKLEITLEKTSCLTRVDQAIYFGICLIELIEIAKLNSSTSLSIRLLTESEIQLIITGIKGLDIKDIGMTLNLLVQQLKGKLNIDGEKLSLVSNSIKTI